MAAAILIDPTNRLLGWSTSDLSLYGGQPAVTVGTPGQAAGDQSFLTIPAPYGGNPASGRQAEALPPSSDGPSGDTGALADAGAASPASFVSSISVPQPGMPIAPAAPVADVLAPQVPTPVGAGSVATAFVAPADAPAGPAGDAPVALAGGLAAASLPAPVIPLASVTEPAVLTGAALGQTLVGPVVDLAAATTGLLVARDGLLDDAADATALLAGTVADTTSVTVGALAGIVPALADVAGTTTEAIAANGADLAEVDALADLGAAVVGDVLTPADAASLDGLAGSDPAGGVTTLVDMVQGADEFDLSQAGTEVAPLTTGGSILDLLADEAGPATLLGDAASSAGLPLPDHDDALGIL